MMYGRRRRICTRIGDTDIWYLGIGGSRPKRTDCCLIRFGAVRSPFWNFFTRRTVVTGLRRRLASVPVSLTFNFTLITKDFSFVTFAFGTGKTTGLINLSDSFFLVTGVGHGVDLSNGVRVLGGRAAATVSRRSLPTSNRCLRGLGLRGIDPRRIGRRLSPCGLRCGTGLIGTGHRLARIGSTSTASHVHFSGSRQRGPPRLSGLLLHGWPGGGLPRCARLRRRSRQQRTSPALARLGGLATGRTRLRAPLRHCW